MARGVRTGAGRRPDPESERSERRKYVLTALPVEGYEGIVPSFPIPDDFGDQLLRERELMIWDDAWRTPQACAWSMEPWRHRIIAQYCRVSALIELSPDPGPGLIAQLHRFRDQLGLTPAGLSENGWRIAVPESSESDSRSPKPSKRSSSRDRMAVDLKVVEGGGG